jgi:low affinity Fe/Cu permease
LAHTSAGAGGSKCAKGLILLAVLGLRVGWGRRKIGEAVCVILVWAVTGPIYHYSDSWQLVINTGTTIVTFLMVFLIQNTQNRDARAINLKLNELIHSIDKAKNQMIDIENLSDLDLDELSARYEKIRSECEERQNRKSVNN